MTGGIVCAGNWIVDIVHTIDAWPAKSALALIRAEAVGVGGGLPRGGREKAGGRAAELPAAAAMA